MTVQVIPTLERMLEMYRLSAAGGERSDRFTSYVDACRSGAPLHGFNPMTRLPVPAELERLLALDAERILRDAAVETVERVGASVDLTLFVSVAAEGMWTDRLGTSAAHLLAPRHVGETLLWFDDGLDAGSIRRAAIEQTARALWWSGREGEQRPEPTLHELALREGAAARLAGVGGRVSDRAAETLEVLGEDRSGGTAVAYFFGDQAALQLGYQPLGLGEDDGLLHAIAVASVDETKRAIRSLLGGR